MELTSACCFVEQVQEMEDLVYELSVHLDTVKDTQSYMKAIKQYHLQGTLPTYICMYPTLLRSASLAE